MDLLNLPAHDAPQCRGEDYMKPERYVNGNLWKFPFAKILEKSFPLGKTGI